MGRDRNRTEQRAARALMESAGIKYTHALRLIREAMEEEKNAADVLWDDILLEKLAALKKENKD